MELKKFRASYRFLPRVQNLFIHKLRKSLKKGDSTLIDAIQLKYEPLHYASPQSDGLIAYPSMSAKFQNSFV